jgi:hypothetical protein
VIALCPEDAPESTKPLLSTPISLILTPSPPFQNIEHLPQPLAIKFELETKPRKAVDIIISRLANIYVPFQPPIAIEGSEDVLIIVRKSLVSHEIERVLCHSYILKKSCNVYYEMLNKYQYDMELRENFDIHFATTTS